MAQNLLQLVYNHVLDTVLGVKRFFILFEYPNQCVPTPDGGKAPRHELSTLTFPTELHAKAHFDKNHDTAPNAFINSISIHSFRLDNFAINWKPWFESILSRLYGRKYYFVVEKYSRLSEFHIYDTSTNIFFSFDEARQYYDKRIEAYRFYNNTKPIGIYSFRTRYPITEHSLWRDRQQGKSLSTTTY